MRLPFLALLSLLLLSSCVPVPAQNNQIPGPNIYKKVWYANAGQNLFAYKQRAQAGELIWVGPGLYSVGVTNLFKDQVNWHFMDGAILSNNVGSVHAPMFDNSGSGVNTPITCSISGDAILVYDSNLAVGVISAPVLISNSASVVNFECKEIRCSSGNNYGSALLVWDARRANFQIKDRINAAYKDSGQGNFSGASCIYWAEGEMYVDCPEMLSCTEAVLWVAVLDVEPGNLWINTQLMVSSNYNCIFMQSHDDVKVWINAKEIKGSSFNGGSFSGHAIGNLGGKLYVTAQKISTLGGTNSTDGLINNQGGQTWITAQKITTTNELPFIQSSGGLFVSCQQYEDLGDALGTRPYNFLFTGGTNVLDGGEAVTKSGPSVKHTGGMLKLKGMTLNTFSTLRGSNVCLWSVGAVTSIVENCTFIPGSLFGVSNSTATDLIIYGTGGLRNRSNITATITPRVGTAINNDANIYR